MQFTINPVWDGQTFVRYEVPNIHDILNLSETESEELKSVVKHMSQLLEHRAKVGTVKKALLKLKESYQITGNLRYERHRPLGDFLECFERLHPPSEISLTTKAFVIASLSKGEWDVMDGYLGKDRFWSWAEENFGGIKTLPDKWLARLRTDAGKRQFLGARYVTDLYQELGSALCQQPITRQPVQILEELSNSPNSGSFREASSPTVPIVTAEEELCNDPDGPNSQPISFKRHYRAPLPPSASPQPELLSDKRRRVDMSPDDGLWQYLRRSAVPSPCQSAARTILVTPASASQPLPPQAAQIDTGQTRTPGAAGRADRMGGLTSTIAQQSNMIATDLEGSRSTAGPLALVETTNARAASQAAASAGAQADGILFMDDIEGEFTGYE